LRWHQARNASSVSRAIESFFLSLSALRRVGISRTLAAGVAKDKYTREEWKRQGFASYLFVFDKYHFALMPKTMKAEA